MMRYSCALALILALSLNGSSQGYRLNSKAKRIAQHDFHQEEKGEHNAADSSSTQQEVEDDADEGKTNVEASLFQSPDWDYHNPHAWSKHYPDCAGDKQSPINLPASLKHKDGEHLWDILHYEPKSGLQIHNNGHAMQVDGDFGTFDLNGVQYNAKQFHLHFPSEHHVAGAHYAGEMHIVHESSVGGEYVVVSLFLKAYREDEMPDGADKEIDFFEKIGLNESLPEEGQRKAISKPVDLNALAAELTGDWWRYEGSLTTPPCSETVHWFVMQNPAIITERMEHLFKERILFDNRPTQPHNDRLVDENTYHR